MKKIDFCFKPTPIEKYFEPELNLSLHIKRDDLTGLIESGNKIRKLEYLMADAKEKNADVIITVGPIQSNHCRATSFFGTRLGLKTILILNAGQRKKIKKNKYQGNLLLDYLLGSDIHFLTSKEYEHKEEYVNQLAEKLRKEGHNPYFIPVGGSNEIGILGYRDCFLEMVDYIKENEIDGVFCAVGSGGTYAGLLLGREVSKMEVPIYGIIVSNSIEYFKEKIRKILEKSESPIYVKESDIRLIDGYVGKGYAIPYPEEIEVIRKWTKKGIVFDPVYTGKAFYGMTKEIHKLGVKNPLFIHTGGIFSLFAYNEVLMEKASH